MINKNVLYKSTSDSEDLILSRFARRTLFEFIPYFLIFFGSLLLSTQIRVEIAVFGKLLNEGYLNLLEPFELLMLIVLASILGTVLAVYLRRLLRVPHSKWIQLIAFVFSLGAMDLYILLLMPDFSQLQLIYHTTIALILSTIAFLLTPKTTAGGQPVSIFYHLFRLKNYRQLWSLWTRYNVKVRYTQTVLGITWIALIPLLTAVIMSLVFSQFWSRADIGQVPFVCFFFSGFLVWNFFQNAINRSMTSLSGYLQLLNQIYFPREVVLLVRLSEDLFDTMFAFIVAVLLNMVFGIFPSFHYIFLPLIFIILIGFILGLGLYISCLSIMVRDIPQLIGVVLRLLFYLTPVIYPLTIVSGKVRFFLLINPMTSLVVALRDIIVYNRMPDLLNLAYPAVLAGILIYSGFSFFKSREAVIVDYL